MFVLVMLYAILLPLEGARFYLLEQIAAHAPTSRRLQRYASRNMAWRQWLARALKDWLVIGIVGGVAARGLMQIEPRVYPVALAGLALLVSLRTCLLLVLLAFKAGVAVPRRLLAAAAHLVLPDLVPGSRKRVVGWGAGFALTGGICLWVWGHNSALPWLCWGFANLTVGFVSFFRGIKYTG